IAAGDFFTRGNFNLLFNQIEIDYFLSNAMLYLNAGIHFHEIEIAVLVYKELYSSHAFVTYGCSSFLSSFAHSGPQFIGNEGRRRFFYQLLVTTLNRAIALTHVAEVAILVACHLNFDVAGL